MKYKSITAEDIEQFFINRTGLLSADLKQKNVVPKTKKYDMSPVIEAAQLELGRLVKKGRLPNGPKPFWAALSVVDKDEIDMTANAGHIYQESVVSERIGRVHVKVGNTSDNEFTQDYVWTSRGEDEDAGCQQLMGRSDDVESLRHHIWSMADASYRIATKNYFNKKALQAEGVTATPKGLGGWSDNPRPINSESYSGKRNVLDVQAYRDLANTLSKYLYDHKDIIDHKVNISGNNKVKVYVDTEGSVGVEHQPYAFIMVEFTVKKDKKHKAKDMIVSYSAVSEHQLPSVEYIIKEIDIHIASVMLSRKAKKASKYVGPAIMSSLVTGTFFHEIIGHRLESGRLLTKDEVSVLLDAKDVTHKNLIFYDDPGIKELYGIRLTGHFGFDEEGVVPEKTVLTQDGGMVNFLSTRTVSKKRRHKSSGHARSDYVGIPEARMGVSVVSVKDESQTLSWISMKKILIEEAKKANLDYGVLIMTCPHGETYIDRSDIQSYRGRTEIMLRLYTDGKLEVVEPLDFIGVPLTSLKVVQGIGAEHLQSVENHGCGSSSGNISVSTIARPLLVGRIEMQPPEDDGVESPVLDRPKFLKA